MLVAAERDSGEGGERHVDPDGPRLDSPRKPVAPRRIACPDCGHQAVLDVVRDPGCVLLVLEPTDRDDRPEDLLLRDRHPVVNVGEYRRGIERALAVERLASGDNLGALRAALLDEAVNLLAVLFGDQRAHLRVGLERVAHPQSLRGVAEGADELVVERRLDKHAGTRLAALAC